MRNTCPAQHSPEGGSVPDRRLHRRNRRGAAIAAATAALLAVGWIHVHPWADPPQERLQRVQVVPVPTPASRQAIVGEVHRSLKSIDDRLIAVAEHELASPSASQRPRDRLMALRIEEASARAAYLNAKLAREVAEIAVIEYREGIFPQEIASVEGEITAAKEGIETARRLAAAVAGEHRKHLLHLYETNDRLSMESSELKKRALKEYTAPRRIKELEAEVARARAVESAKQAEWKLLTARRERAQDAVAGDRGGSDPERHSLALLEHASRLEQQIHAKLDRYIEQGRSDDSLHKEIRRRTNELRAVADLAEAAAAADDFAALRTRIREAARRLGVVDRE
jgi:hypothetical protein